MLDYLFVYYFPKEVEASVDNPTLEELFPEWLEFKMTITDSPSTITVHEKHFKKYFTGTPLFQMPIKKISLKDLNLWANQLVRDFDLSSKQWQTIKTVPKQMFEYAMAEGFIDVNPFPSLKVTVKFRQLVKKKSETQVFDSEEFDLLTKDLWTSFEKSHEVRFLAVIWNFFVGLRAGELSGLKWSDVDFEKKSVCIRREVICVQDSKLQNAVYQKSLDSGDMVILPEQEGRLWKYVLVQHTKTNTERTIELPEVAVEMLK